MVAWLTAGLAATPGFGSEDPLAPVEQAQWYHQELTKTAASAAGWGASAAAELAQHALGVDLYAYHVVWSARGGRRRRRGARMAKGPLDNVHFDNLASTPEIAEVWQRTIGGTMVGVEWAARQNDVRAARQVIGVSLHAIQDFYSHSTWVDDPDRRSRGWLQDAGVEPEPGLSTGGFGAEADSSPHRHGDTRPTWRSITRLPALLGIPGFATAASARRGRSAVGAPAGLRYGRVAGINLDSRWQAEVAVRARHLVGLDAEATFEAALECARRESQLWLERLDHRFATDPNASGFWAQVRSGPELDWTEAYDDPAVLAYNFLAAGRYPPRNSVDSTRWFYRILVSPRPGHRPRWWSRRGELRVLDAHGRKLNGAALPIGQAVVVGPAPATACQLELHLPRAHRLQIQAFRRAPEPLLQLVIDRSLGIADSVVRVPIEI